MWKYSEFNVRVLSWPAPTLLDSFTDSNILFGKFQRILYAPGHVIFENKFLLF